MKRNSPLVVPLESSPLHGLRLLVVDNNADSGDLLTAVFQEDGVETIVVATVGEALALLEHLQPDLLISEIVLPDEDGYSLIQKIKALEVERNVQIPAIALTTCTSQEDRTHALLAGFRKHLSKPIDIEELIGTVAHLTGRFYLGATI